MHIAILKKIQKKLKKSVDFLLLWVYIIITVQRLTCPDLKTVITIITINKEGIFYEKTTVFY